jgi:nucleotide-binding universal stress UspA family protein
MQEVVVVFVQNFNGAGLNEFSMAAAKVMQEVFESERTVVEAQSITILDSARLPWRFEVRTGDPATELMKVASEYSASTIIVGVNRRNRLVGLVCGNVSTTVHNCWPQSSLIVRYLGHGSLETGKSANDRFLSPLRTWLASARQRHWVRVWLRSDSHVA